MNNLIHETAIKFIRLHPRRRIMQEDKWSIEKNNGDHKKKKLKEGLFNR